MTSSTPFLHPPLRNDNEQNIQEFCHARSTNFNEDAISILNTVDSGYSHSSYSHTLVNITILIFPEFRCGQTLLNELLLQSLHFLSHSAHYHYFFPSQTTKYSLYSHILGKILMKFYITYIITVLGDLLQFMQQPGTPSNV